MAVPVPLKVRLLTAARRAFKALALALLLSVVLGNLWVVNSSEADLFTNWATLPENEVGLVLGTSPYTGGGAPNPHFEGRIAAAVELYQLGRIKQRVRPMQQQQVDMVGLQAPQAGVNTGLDMGGGQVITFGAVGIGKADGAFAL